MLQLVPFHCSIRVWLSRSELPLIRPTAAIPVKALVSGGLLAGAGVGTTLKLVPFHCATAGWSMVIVLLPILILVKNPEPAIQTSVGEIAVIALAPIGSP